MTDPAAPSAAAADLAALHGRVSDLERRLGEALKIVASMRHPGPDLDAMARRLDAMEGAGNRLAASLAGLRSLAEGAAAAVKDRATFRDVENTRDGMIAAIGEIFAEHGRDGKAALAGLAAEVARARGGSPAASAASVIRAHLAQWTAS